MTAREIKNHAEVPPPRKEIYSVASILGLIQLVGYILFAILPNRDSLRDVVEANRLLKAQFDAHMEADQKKWDSVYQKELADAQPKAEMRAAIKRIDSYFDNQQRRQ